MKIPSRLIQNTYGFCATLCFVSGSERKKSIRLAGEFNRSVSVPVDKVALRLPGHSSAPNQTPTTPESE